MSNIISAIRDDMNAYEALCKKHGEPMVVDKHGEPDCYGRHAKAMKQFDVGRANRPCDCLNDCGDDPRLRTCEVAKCDESIAMQAARRAEAWQAFDTWWRTPPGGLALAPMRFMDEMTAKCAWFAAKRSK